MFYIKILNQDGRRTLSAISEIIENSIIIPSQISLNDFLLNLIQQLKQQSWKINNSNTVKCRDIYNDLCWRVAVGKYWNSSFSVSKLLHFHKRNNILCTVKSLWFQSSNDLNWALIVSGNVPEYFMDSAWNTCYVMRVRAVVKSHDN